MKNYLQSRLTHWSGHLVQIPLAQPTQIDFQSSHQQSLLISSSKISFNTSLWALSTWISVGDGSITFAIAIFVEKFETLPKPMSTTSAFIICFIISSLMAAFDIFNLSMCQRCMTCLMFLNWSDWGHYWFRPIESCSRRSAFGRIFTRLPRKKRWLSCEKGRWRRFEVPRRSQSHSSIFRTIVPSFSCTRSRWVFSE